MKPSTTCYSFDHVNESQTSTANRRETVHSSAVTTRTAATRIACLRPAGFGLGLRSIGVAMPAKCVVKFGVRFELNLSETSDVENLVKIMGKAFPTGNKALNISGQNPGDISESFLETSF